MVESKITNVCLYAWEICILLWYSLLMLLELAHEERAKIKHYKRIKKILKSFVSDECVLINIKTNSNIIVFLICLSKCLFSKLRNKISFG